MCYILDVNLEKEKSGGFSRIFVGLAQSFCFEIFTFGIYKRRVTIAS